MSTEKVYLMINNTYCQVSTLSIGGRFLLVYSNTWV